MKTRISNSLSLIVALFGLKENEGLGTHDLPRVLNDTTRTNIPHIIRYQYSMAL